MKTSEKENNHSKKKIRNYKKKISKTCKKENNYRRKAMRKLILVIKHILE